MTERERVLKIVDGGRPDRLPWFADLAYWIEYLNDCGLMPEKYLLPEEHAREEAKIGLGIANEFNEKGLQLLHRDVGAGFYLAGYFPWKTEFEGVDIDEEITYQGKDQVRVTTVHTPFGDMQEVWVYYFDNHCWGPKVNMVQGLEDLKKIRYLYEHTFYEPDYDLAQRRYETIGDNGVVLCYMPRSPMAEMAVLRAGIENCTYMISDDEDEWAHTISVVEKKLDEACEISLASPAECIMIPDNLSSEMVGLSYYDKYYKGFHSKWCSRIKEAGKFSLVHLDGTVKPLITELCKSGFDVIEAVTPAPVGDQPFKKIRPLMSEQTIIWGGIPGGYFHPTVSDEVFDEFVISLIDAMKEDGRSVLAVGDQVVPGSSFERVARAKKLVEEYGYF